MIRPDRPHRGWRRSRPFRTVLGHTGQIGRPMPPVCRSPDSNGPASSPRGRRGWCGIALGAVAGDARARRLSVRADGALALAALMDPAGAPVTLRAARLLDYGASLRCRRLIGALGRMAAAGAPRTALSRRLDQLLIPLRRTSPFLW